MPYVNCPCGLTYDVSLKEGACPKCGATPAGSSAPADAKIRFACACGAKLSATIRFVGRSIECPACGASTPVPSRSTLTETARAAPTARRISGTATRPPSRPDGWRSTARWSLFVALIPLAIFTFSGEDDRQERTERTIKSHPELDRKLQGKKRTLDNVLPLLPGRRVEGAALPRDTRAHWVVALIAALVFWEFILIVQPMGNSTSRQLWAVGIFTGTIGILMLLIVQVAAFLSAIAGGVGCFFVLFIVVLKFIGYSYAAALDPANGFLASMIGFTFGVGLCEELCKALPLFWHFRRSGSLDARGAVVWGLASGIGFGVSEGISYSHSFYNGIDTGGVYVVRFISCVALHAIWSATAALFIWRRQADLQGFERWYQWFPTIFRTLGISMLLHGFYDTCLKKNFGVAALASAMLSFALFFWLYDRACREERTLRRTPVLAEA